MPRCRSIVAHATAARAAISTGTIVAFALITSSTCDSRATRGWLSGDARRHEPGHGDPAIVENAARHRMRVASCKPRRMT
jgi:hypothetical protein